SLKADPHASVVHEVEHVLEAFAPFADQLGWRTIEEERGRAGTMVTQLLLDAFDGGPPLATPVGEILVRLHEKHRESAESREGIIGVVNLLGARNDEVILSVSGSDEDFLSRHEPVAIFVLLTRRPKGRHVAPGIGLGDVHTAPGLALADL